MGLVIVRPWLASGGESNGSELFEELFSVSIQTAFVYVLMV